VFSRISLVASMVAVTASMFVADDAQAQQVGGVVMIPAVSGALGPSIPVSSDVTMDTQFSFDARAGVMMIGGSEAQFTFIPQLGYAYDGVGANLATLTPTIGVGWPMLGYVTYQPEVMVGSLDRGETAEGGATFGMRNSVGFHGFANAFFVDVGHQFLTMPEGLHHSVVVSAGADVAGLVMAFI